MFSRRTDWDLTPNRLSRAVEARRQAGREIIDLTESNPTRCDLDCWGEDLLREISSPKILRYDPQPFGPSTARRAVADDYRRQGSPVTEDRVVLTCSTSESYSHLFRLLADPGDRILVPAPSYPLFPFLLRLDHLELGTYPLTPGDSFRIDLDALASAIDAKTRAILVVNPGNPSGAFLKREEAGKLLTLCRRHDLALISDEVFSSYSFADDPQRQTTLAGSDEVLTFTLNGASKSLGLPQLKVGWIVVSGPADVRRRALSRLEVIADTFLSVNTPAAGSLPFLLENKPRVTARILTRVRDNRNRLLGTFTASHPVRCLPAEGGWYAILRVPTFRTEEEWCLHLLENWGVLLHPGFFYDFADPGYLVASLLPPPDRFQCAVDRLNEAFTA